MDLPVINQSRKFKEIGFYKSSNLEYSILPFKFYKLTHTKEALTNDYGNFLIVPIGTANRIVSRNIDESEDLYKELFSNFFISDKPLPDLIDVLATRYRTKKSFLEEFTSLHIFVITLRCNHSCHYCQVSRVSENIQEYDMSFENLDLSIQHMFCTSSKSITIEFQGGEPLLAFDKIKYAVLKTKKENVSKSKNISFVICTNSTVFSDEILIFCKTHEIILSTSLDGPEFIHNANRPKSGAKSYQLVVDGIKQARSIVGNGLISALMTTTSLSLDYPIEIIDNYILNGFSNIFLRPISPYGFALKDKKKNSYEIDKYLNFYKLGLEYIIELNKNGTYFSEDYTTIILKKILTPFSVNYVDLQSPAGLINSVIVFNYDGYIYASDESRMLAENQDFTFRLGHVNEEYQSIFYNEKSELISQYSCNESLAGCADCGLQTYCGADPVFHYATQGDPEGYRPTSDFCKKNMEIISHILRLIDTRGEEVLPIFYSWINNKGQVIQT